MNKLKKKKKTDPSVNKKLLPAAQLLFSVGYTVSAVFGSFFAMLGYVVIWASVFSANSEYRDFDDGKTSEEIAEEMTELAGDLLDFTAITSLQYLGGAFILALASLFISMSLKKNRSKAVQKIVFVVTVASIAVLANVITRHMIVVVAG